MISSPKVDWSTTCCGIKGFSPGVPSILDESWIILVGLRLDGFWLGAILSYETTTSKGKDNSQNGSSRVEFHLEEEFLGNKVGSQRR